MTTMLEASSHVALFFVWMPLHRHTRIPKRYKYVYTCTEHVHAHTHRYTCISLHLAMLLLKAQVVATLGLKHSKCPFRLRMYRDCGSGPNCLFLSNPQSETLNHDVREAPRQAKASLEDGDTIETSFLLASGLNLSPAFKDLT